MAKKASMYAVIVAVIVAAFVVVLGVWAMSMRGDGSGNTSAPPHSNETITVEGEYVCLPKKGDGPHTLECAFGLHAEDGEYYGLDFSGVPNQSVTAMYQVGDRLRVTGEFEATENSIYTSKGNILVNSAEQLD